MYLLRVRGAKWCGMSGGYLGVDGTGLTVLCGDCSPADLSANGGSAERSGAHGHSAGNALRANMVRADVSEHWSKTRTV